MNTKLHWETHPDIGFRHLSWRDLIFAEILAPKVAEKRVLDLGCGGGALSNFLMQQGASVIGLDFSSSLINIARSNFDQTDKLKFIEADILTVDLGEQFDIICGLGILHEISHVDTPKLLDFFDRHLKADGFGWFQENSFFNPVFRFVRNRMVGKYGIPKFGSDQETPFDRQRFELYQCHFKYCERSTEAFYLFSEIHKYLIRSRSNRVSSMFAELDKFISSLSVPDILIKDLSYWQHIYFSQTVPKTGALPTKSR